MNADLTGRAATAVKPDVPAQGWPDEVLGIREMVPVLDGTSRRYINLDNAASTPPLVAVRDTVREFTEWYSSVHRGTGFKSQVSTRAYEAAREAVLDFVGADPATHTAIFVKHTTEALNRLSHVLESRKPLVFTTIMEHHANMLPWRVYAGGVRYIPVDEDGVWDLDALEHELRHAPRHHLRLVAVAGAYNSSGYTPDIHAVARLAHQYGAQIVVDGAQLVPHKPVRMRGTDDGDHIDFLAFSAHKMYAPFGTGVLVAPRDAFRGAPEELGGGIVDLVTLHRVVWTEIPEREEAGSPNVIGAIALHAAIERLKRIGMDNVARHEAMLTRYAYDRIAHVPGFRLLGPQNPEHRVGLFSTVNPEISGYKVAAILGTEFGIGVRAGCFCAHPGMIHLLRVPENSMKSFEESILDHRNPGAVRASMAIYNSHADIDAYADALTAITEGRYQGEYRHDEHSGNFVAANWNVDLDQYFSVPRAAGVAR